VSNTFRGMEGTWMRIGRADTRGIQPYQAFQELVYGRGKAEAFDNQANKNQHLEVSYSNFGAGRLDSFNKIVQKLLCTLNHPAPGMPQERADPSINY
jgi:hypothetical protein